MHNTCWAYWRWYGVTLLSTSAAIPPEGQHLVPREKQEFPYFYTLKTVTYLSAYNVGPLSNGIPLVGRWLVAYLNAYWNSDILVSWVRCGTWLYRFLIFAPLLTFISMRPADKQYVIKLCFLNFLPKRMLWELKRGIEFRWLFWAPKHKFVLMDEK